MKLEVDAKFCSVFLYLRTPPLPHTPTSAAFRKKAEYAWGTSEGEELKYFFSAVVYQCSVHNLTQLVGAGGLDAGVLDAKVSKATEDCGGSCNNGGKETGVEPSLKRKDKKPSSAAAYLQPVYHCIPSTFWISNSNSP